MVSALAPKVTPVAPTVVAEDVPSSDLIVAPVVVPEISKIPAPLITTPDEGAILPVPVKASLPPLIAVLPV